MAGMRFGRFELQVAARQLLADGVPLPLGGRAFDMLVVLVEQCGRIVDKDTLLARVWPGRHMAENNLTVQVSALRRALGAEVVRTVPGRGYCLALPVEAAMQLPASLLAPASQVLPGPDAGAGAMALAAVALGAVALGGASHGVMLPPLPPEAPVLLYASLSAPSPGAELLDARASLFDTALRGLVPAHGGQLQESRPQRWLARFYSMRDAVACCRQLHDTVRSQSAGLAPAQTPLLQLALHRPDGPPRQQVETVARLAALASHGQIMASAAAADQFVPALDGDVVDLGERQLGVNLNPMRVYCLVPGDPHSAGPGRVIDLRHDLLPTVAVIPPRCLGQRTSGIDAVGDILTDQVIAALSRSRVMNVICRLSTQPLRDRALSASQIARVLGAQYVVSGYCIPSGERLQVQLSVADGHTDRVLDSVGCEDQVHAVLQTDSDLVRTLVAGITRLIVHNEVLAARTLPLPNLGSHTLLLGGISMMFRLASTDFERAYQAMDTVRQRAPHHPAPLVWLARWHLFRLAQGWSDNREYDGRTAIDLANRALDIDPQSSLALTMLANAHITHLRDLDSAESLSESALAHNPNESLAWLQKGNARSFRGDGLGALADTRHAVMLSPLDPARHYFMGLMASAALSAQQFDQAISAAREALKLNREHLSTHRVLAIALAMSRRMDEARSSVAQLLRLDPQMTVARFLARSPGQRSGLAETFGQALRDAGVPAGQA
jgi:DNA-binding winged helix-turn-helix (wHTH) protein/TolB-like protein